MARPRAHIDASALAEAFAADGLHGTSSAALAEALGVAKPTLYVHGQSKDALFLRAVEAEVERVLDHLHAANRTGVGRTARFRATAAAQALLEYAALRPLGARLLSRTATHESSSVAAAVQAAVQRIPDRIEAGLRRDLTADGLDPTAAPFLARAIYGSAVALSERRGAERRPARAVLAAIAAAAVPEPALNAGEWPVA